MAKVANACSTFETFKSLEATGRVLPFLADVKIHGKRVGPPHLILGPGPPAETAAQATHTGEGQAIGADGGTNGGGLSAGAIAGIVIGTLAGVALLLLLCFCCIARGLWAAIFGRKHKKTERVDVYEERYSRHGSRVPSAYSRKDRHSGWFGGRPASAVDRPEKKSGGGAWLAIAGAAGTILALLNLKKNKREPPRKVMSSRYSDSYYTYSDVTTSPTRAPVAGPLTPGGRETAGLPGPTTPGPQDGPRSAARPRLRSWTWCPPFAAGLCSTMSSLELL
ncbi:hypothetical protein HIM_11346 [Hirsutella minnesotensis 3608]|uniref:Uncharacterized protein n=1 Tax=Hirsutella minnesotensis 3608 TaxID=1043627 RepID=A0A0F7ZWN1_9HYPO|nr:hypothetical protein HIM_11346 [Hirsutella minnesotensis 3608]